MRRHVAVLAVAALAGTACDGAGQLVEDARTQVEEAAETAEFCVAALRVAAAVDSRDVDALVRAGEAFVADAPDEVRPDAQLLLDAGRRARDGDEAALADPAVTDAAARVRDVTEQRCNPAADDV